MAPILSLNARTVLALHAKALFEDGYTVVPSLPLVPAERQGDEESPDPLEPEEVEAHKSWDAFASVEAFHKAMNEFPEFKDLPPMAERVMGGFGALGNPSSFHHPYVQRLRRHVYRACRPVLRQYVCSYAMQYPWCIMGMDRLMFRPPTIGPSQIIEHKDLVKGVVNFGGWINLGTTDNFLSCTPKSHSTDPGSISGFTVLGRNGKVSSNKMRVRVGPGEILLFNSSMTHDIIKTKPKASEPQDPQYRMFINFQLSATQRVPDGIKDAIEAQGVPRLPTGDAAEMYSQLHKANWIDRLQAFSLQSFPTQLLVGYTPSSASRGRSHPYVVDPPQGKAPTYLIVPRVMPSLSVLGLPPFPYAEIDKLLVTEGCYYGRPF